MMGLYRGRGVFVTFEGVEGCGKTTQAEMLKEYLEKKGWPTLLTREPGGTHLGEGLRTLLLSDRGLSPWAELLLYLACRAQLVEEVIGPALSQGKVVICDRFSDSTVAYQGYGKGMPMDAIELLNRWVAGGLKPDVTILLDIEPEEGLKRARKRGGENRFEKEDIGFHRRVWQGYREIASREPRIRVVDARREASLIHREVCGIIDQVLRGRI